MIVVAAGVCTKILWIGKLEQKTVCTVLTKINFWKPHGVAIIVDGILTKRVGSKTLTINKMNL